MLPLIALYGFYLSYFGNYGVKRIIVLVFGVVIIIISVFCLDKRQKFTFVKS